MDGSKSNDKPLRSIKINFSQKMIKDFETRVTRTMHLSQSIVPTETRRTFKVCYARVI